MAVIDTSMDFPENCHFCKKKDCFYNHHGWYIDGKNYRTDRHPSCHLKEVLSGKWIPVSERLPKTDEYVGNVAKYYLVQNEYGDMLVARYTHSEYWEQIYQLKPVADEIVAWMPLPRDYSEVKE